MGYKSTFQSKDHEIVFDKEAQGFIIDKKVFIPMIKVTEVALELTEPVIIPIIEPVLDLATKQFKKVKKANGGE